MSDFSIVIPTYKRPGLLALLLQDLACQTRVPRYFVIVDGDPDSGAVRDMLCSLNLGVATIRYVPSNHGNLSYQRYLGWKAAATLGVDFLVYFDDDQRIYQHDVIDWLLNPMFEPDSDVVGVGCYSRQPEGEGNSATVYLQAIKQTPRIVKKFGSRAALDLKPGQLTPTGHRVGLVDRGQDYVETHWLQGRIMAYRISAMSEKTFSDDLFALDHVRCGLGEDTFLSRRVGALGKLKYTFRAVVDHPEADTPKSYPYEAYKYAYAATYSRRFLNDYYRVYESATIQDRWALVRSYLGIVLLAWIRVITKPNNTNWALAKGITVGALHGLMRPPTAKQLTPEINWRRDAEAALQHAEDLVTFPD
jgi:GT2 family glycosyltransferase